MRLREQVEFVVPKYKWEIRWGLPFFALLLFGMVPDAVRDPTADPFLTFSAVLFAAFVLVTPFALIRRIQLGVYGLTVEYYLRPSKRVPYGDIRDINPVQILTAKGTLVISGMKNREELVEAVVSRVKDGQLSGETRWAWLHVVPKALLISVVAIPFLVVAVWSLPIAEEWWVLALLGAWSVTYVLAYFAVRALSQQQHA